MGYAYDLIEQLEEKKYSYYYDKKGFVVVHEWGDVYIKVKRIDERIIFENKGGVEVDSLNPLPDGLRFNNKGDVYIIGEFQIPYDIEFNNEGSVQFDPGSTLPEGIVFNNKGDIWLEDVNDLPENVTFNNEGEINLATYTKIPASTKFNEKNGDIFLNSLKSVSPEIQFHNRGILVLGKIDPRAREGWKGFVPGIDDKRLINFMIKKGLFI